MLLCFVFIFALRLADAAGKPCIRRSARRFYQRIRPELATGVEKSGFKQR
jgi:hypothetical protein